MTKALRGQVTLVTPSSGSGATGAIGYSSVGQGTNPTDVTFPITPDQIAMVQYAGSDFTNAPEPVATGDVTTACFANDQNAGPDDVKYSGGGFVTGDGTVTLSLDAMTGGNGGVINVIVVALGSSSCETGH